jgi:hypothetical protein
MYQRSFCKDDESDMYIYHQYFCMYHWSFIMYHWSFSMYHRYFFLCNTGLFSVYHRYSFIYDVSPTSFFYNVSPVFLTYITNLFLCITGLFVRTTNLLCITSIFVLFVCITLTWNRYCVSGRHNLPILSRLVWVDYLIITMKDNKTIDFVFLKNKSRTMIIFVSESQSKKHDHFR